MSSEPSSPPGEPKPGVSDHEKEWASYCHWSGVAGLLLGLFSFVGPLLMWKMRKDTSTYIDQHGKEALNFQLNIAIYSACCLLAIVITRQQWLVVALLAVLVYGGVMAVLAGKKAQQGELYQYPGNVRLVK